MIKPNIKDLRTTLHVLDFFGNLAPDELKVEISKCIRQAEDTKTEKRMSRLSDDELYKYENRKKTTLRINLSDGRLIQRKTNDQTFDAALLEIGLERLATTSFFIKNHPLVLHDATLQRRRCTGYRYLAPGLFVYKKTTVFEKQNALLHYDECLCLDWDIEIR